MYTIANYSKKASVSPEILNEYNNNLEMTIQDVPQSNIYNYNEPKLTDNPEEQEKHCRNSYQIPLQDNE